MYSISNSSKLKDSNYVNNKKKLRNKIPTNLAR